jgi:membrane-associated phospholipid phosphatase
MRFPSREVLYWYLGLSFLLDLMFITVYGGSNWLNSHREAHYFFYASWELGIPLIPEMIFPYLSIGLFFLLPLLVLNKAQMITLAKRMAYAIIIAGIIFNLVPTELGFQRALKSSAVYPVFQLIYFLDQPYNLFPSLHITLSSVLLVMLLPRSEVWFRFVLLLWWLLLCLSVMLVHQHHLADIAGGLILAWAVKYLAPHSEASQTISDAE